MSDIEGNSVQLIRLANGLLIDPLTREPINMQPAKSAARPAQSRTPEPIEPEEDDEDADEDDDAEVNDLTLRPTARRSIMDLALSPQQMAMINNVLVYTLYGLPDDEISIQCNCAVHHIHVIRDLDDYKRMYTALVEGLRAAYTNTVQGIIQDAAPIAARSIVRKMKNKSQDISMAAIKDVLDRSGHRPADRVEHSHSFGEGELVIRVIRQDDEKSIPTLELDVNA